MARGRGPVQRVSEVGHHMGLHRFQGHWQCRMCRASAIWRWRSQSSARLIAVVMSQAPGLLGTPSLGQCSSAATSASCASSSATPRSRTRDAPRPRQCALTRCARRRQWFGERRNARAALHLCGCCHFVHPEHFPLVAVQVGKTVLEHEAVVLWCIGCGGTGGHGLGDHVFDLGAAVNRQRQNDFGGLGGRR
jgi:hypothetical protein